MFRLSPKRSIRRSSFGTGFANVRSRGQLPERREDMMTTPQVNTVGVFAGRTQADRSVTELRQAGFHEDQIAVAVPRGDGPGAATGIVVTVQADHRHDEAVTILQYNGAQSTQRVAR
jgi:hypothetical protein